MADPQRQHCPKIMKPPQSLPLPMAERLLRAQPDSVASHVTARSISDWHALTRLATETGWALWADQTVWPPSLSCDTKWPRITKCIHSRVVGFRLDKRLFQCGSKEAGLVKYEGSVVMICIKWFVFTFTGAVLGRQPRTTYLPIWPPMTFCSEMPHYCRVVIRV